MEKKRVFISYSHKDKEEKELLHTHIKVLEHEGIYSIWEDNQISLGSDWIPEIEANLDSASVALLLISANFLTSGFILNKEIPQILKRRAEEGLAVIPVVIKPAAWQDIDWLSRMQVFPRGKKTLSEMVESKRERKLSELAVRVKRIIQSSMLSSNNPFDTDKEEKSYYKNKDQYVDEGLQDSIVRELSTKGVLRFVSSIGELLSIPVSLTHNKRLYADQLVNGDRERVLDIIRSAAEPLLDKSSENYITDLSERKFIHNAVHNLLYLLDRGIKEHSDSIRIFIDKSCKRESEAVFIGEVRKLLSISGDDFFESIEAFSCSKSLDGLEAIEEVISKMSSDDILSEKNIISDITIAYLVSLYSNGYITSSVFKTASSMMSIEIEMSKIYKKTPKFCVSDAVIGVSLHGKGAIHEDLFVKESGLSDTGVEVDINKSFSSATLILNEKIEQSRSKIKPNEYDVDINVVRAYRRAEAKKGNIFYFVFRNSEKHSIGKRKAIIERLEQTYSKDAIKKYQPSSTSEEEADILPVVESIIKRLTQGEVES